MKKKMEWEKMKWVWVKCKTLHPYAVKYTWCGFCDVADIREQEQSQQSMEWKELNTEKEDGIVGEDLVMIE